MPTYEYKCKLCGHGFEKIQKMSEDSLRVCPKCHKESVSRIIHGGALVFKGSGFYLTDYKKSKDNKTESKHEIKKDSKSESKKEQVKKD